MAIRKEVGVGILITGIILIVVAAVVALILPSITSPTVDVSIGNGIFKSRIAKSQPERDALMSEVSKVTGSNSLLFAYPDEGKWSVDVSGIKDPVDVVWMDSDKKITTIYKNASSALVKSGRLTASAMVKYVMILPSNSINLMAIGIGKVATFQINVDEIK